MNIARASWRIALAVSLLVSVHTISVHTASAQLGQGDGRDDPVASSDVTSPTFWTPSSHGGSGPLPIVNDRRKHTAAVHTPDNMPWSGSIWGTTTADLAFRGGGDQSPLEKYDTLYADRNAPRGAQDLRPHLPRGSHTAAGLEFAGAARWEGDPRSGYNTAEVRLNSQQVARKPEQQFDVVADASDVEIRRSGAAPSTDPRTPGTVLVRSAGKDYSTRAFTSVQDGRTYELFYYAFQADAQGNTPPTAMEGRFVRFPIRQEQADDASATWWHAYPRRQSDGTWTMHGEANVRAEVVPESGQGTGGGGSVEIEYAGEKYPIRREFRDWFQWGGTRYPTCDYYEYEPTEFPDIPGQDTTNLRNYFILYPSESVPAPAGGRKWVHVTWKAVPYQADPSGFDGHCNGFAAASILFREPREEKRFRLSHGQKLRLNVTSASAALPANFQAQALPNGVEAKPIDYLPPDPDGEETEVVLGVADLKGLMTALSMWPAVSFDTAGGPRRDDFGTRAEQGQGEDSEAWRDIHPHHMHRILIEYLQERDQPVVMDRSYGRSIWNLPIYGYEYRIKDQFRAGHRYFTDTRGFYRLEAAIKYVGYGAANHVGPPVTGEIKYEFDLILDEQNRVAGSRWLNDSARNHPDFLWAPVGFHVPQEIPGQRWPVNLNLSPKFLLEELLVDNQGKSYLRELAYVPGGVSLPPRR